jgi:hypothetical protein
LPAYNEEVAIGSVVLRTRKYADRVIVVDDGSLGYEAEVPAMAGAALKTEFAAAGAMEELGSSTKARGFQTPNKKRFNRFASFFSSSFFINIIKSVIIGVGMP